MTINSDIFAKFWFYIVNNITNFSMDLINANRYQVSQEWVGETVGLITVILSVVSFILTVYVLVDGAIKILKYCWGLI